MVTWGLLRQLRVNNGVAAARPARLQYLRQVTTLVHRASRQKWAISGSAHLDVITWPARHCGSAWRRTPAPRPTCRRLQPIRRFEATRYRGDFYESHFKTDPYYNGSRLEAVSGTAVPSDLKSTALSGESGMRAPAHGDANHASIRAAADGGTCAAAPDRENYSRCSIQRMRGRNSRNF